AIELIDKYLPNPKAITEDIGESKELTESESLFEEGTGFSPSIGTTNVGINKHQEQFPK
ncbi:hypothetical protein HZC32_02450, partial [Candidatus Woesearchaeota archaeon]|nr:hypothetical protein [Candidatus Woesearchaeota archaeon]